MSDIRIYKFQPFSVTKDLGDEYNGHCELVPNDDDWILILDYDAMILTYKAYQVIENAILKYPGTKIFGAMTNRVGLSFQRLCPDPDENDSIKHHLKIAEELVAQYPDGECRRANQAGGFFLLFQKSYWKENKFQTKVMNERGIFFDWVFTKSAGKIEGAIRIIKGVYVWHTYRINKNRFDKTHLKS